MLTDLTSLATAVRQIEAEKSNANRFYMLKAFRAAGKRALLCWSCLRKDV